MGGLALTRENALVFIVVISFGVVSRFDVGSATSGSRTRVRHEGPRTVRLPDVVSSLRAWRSCCCPWPRATTAVGGGFYLTTSQFGSNFYIGNNPGADGTYVSLRFGRGAPEYERQDATELAEHASGGRSRRRRCRLLDRPRARLHHGAARRLARS